MYINRQIEQALNKAAGQTKVVLLTGARQVGKTTAIREIFHDYDYITLDDENELRLAQEDRTLFFRDRRFPVIIDEVQYAKELFSTVKFLVDQRPEKGQVYLTGSQTYELLTSSAESLAGRVSILEMPPLSMREMNGIKVNLPFLPDESYYSMREKEIFPYNDVWNQIHRGFYPDLSQDERDWTWFYRDYVRTYIERDVRKIINIKDETKFRNFLSATAALSGCMLKYETLANAAGVDIKTAKSWISVLNGSGLIKLVPTFQNNALKRTIRAPKLYMMDTGLMCYLVGWTTADSAKNGAMSGEIFETFVVSEIIKSYLNAGENIENIYYYRDKDQKEIDLVIKNGQKLYPIEIKKSGTIQKQWVKNFSALKKTEDLEVQDGCVICRVDKRINITENEYALPIEYI